MTIRPPGPKGHFWWGQLSEFRHDMLGLYQRLTREYGDVVAFRLGPRSVWLVNHPDLIEFVLSSGSRHFKKSFAYQLLVPVIGRGLLTSEGSFWLRQRRLAQPAFHRQRIAAFGDVMVAYTQRLLDRWRPGEVRDLHADMMRLTLEIVAKTLFDFDLAEEAADVGAALEVVQENFSNRFEGIFPLPTWFPSPSNLRLRRAVRRLDQILYGIIDQRRKSQEDKGDLLSMLLHARDEDDGSGMTDQQLRDEAMTLFLAGHETTALALSWLWYLLAQHPAVEATLLAELREALGDRPPTVADLPRLRYTEAVVHETMRLYPPAYSMGREAIEPCELGGYPVPVGQTIEVCQWLTQRDPRWFNDPERFMPERWLDGREKRLPRYAYFPFGGGPRQCIGNTFALMEAVLVLATMAPRVRLELDPNHRVVPWTSITLRPRTGIRVLVHRRQRQRTLPAASPVSPLAET